EAGMVRSATSPCMLRQSCFAGPSVPNLKFATLFGSRTERTSNSKSTLESIFSSVAYDFEIRRVLTRLALHQYEANFEIATLAPRASVRAAGSPLFPPKSQML